MIIANQSIMWENTTKYSFFWGKCNVESGQLEIKMTLKLQRNCLTSMEWFCRSAGEHGHVSCCTCCPNTWVCANGSGFSIKNRKKDKKTNSHYYFNSWWTPTPMKMLLFSSFFFLPLGIAFALKEKGSGVHELWILKSKGNYPLPRALGQHIELLILCQITFVMSNYML